LSKLNGDVRHGRLLLILGNRLGRYLFVSQCSMLYVLEMKPFGGARPCGLIYFIGNALRIDLERQCHPLIDHDLK